MQTGPLDRLYLRLYPTCEKSGTFHILYRLLSRHRTDRVDETAAHLAYFFLFSLFPLLIFLNALIGLFELDTGELIHLLGVLPAELGGLLGGYVDYLQQVSTPSLMATGLLLTVWFLSRAGRSLILCINSAMRIHDTVSPVGLFVKSLILTALLLLTILLALVFVLTGQELLALLEFFFPQILPLITFWGRVRTLITAGFFLCVLVLIYTVSCNSKISAFKMLPGALFAMAAWLAASTLFSTYVDHVARYSFLYGSLGTIIVLMMWLYILATVLVMGAELNHILTTNSEWRAGQQALMRGAPPHAIRKD